MANPAGGRSVDSYRAPLFIAWQLTNRCRARCLTCCEESGPDKAWRDELTRAEALDLAHAIAGAGIPYAAFGGGEPLGVPHAWEIFEILAAAGTAIKLETEGSYIDDAAADEAIVRVKVPIDRRSLTQPRPGATVEARIFCGRRSLGYVWLHDLVDAVRGWFW